MRIETSFVKVGSTVLLFSVFLALGLWQMNRAEEKRVIRDRIVARAEMPALQVDAEPFDVEEMTYRDVVANGHYLREFQILLDNQVFKGQAGYHVLTPLRLTGTRTLLLVNRGWAPWGPDRQREPEIDLSEELSRVRGRLVGPTMYAINFEHMEQGRNQGFPSIWQNVDLDRYERLTGFEVKKLVLRLDPAQADAAALVREWPVHTDMWVERHRAYAFQWFGLAIALLCVFLVLSFKRGNRSSVE